MLGCDMLKILYDSDVKNGYYQGWRDQVTNSGGYLLSLVHMGVTVQSAYKTLSENNVNAWMVVQNKFGGILDAAAQYVLKWD